MATEFEKTQIKILKRIIDMINVLRNNGFENQALHTYTELGIQVFKLMEELEALVKNE